MSTYFNLPDQVSQDYYEGVREEIKSLFYKDKSVLSVYEYGSVSSPGVSDIDLIFILRDNNQLTEGLFDLQNASDSAKKLVSDGTVIKMPRETMENLYFIDELFPKKLMGEDITLKLPTDTEKEFIKSVALIDWMPERILKLGKMFNSDSINVNHALCTLHSFCYSLKSLNKILGKTDESIEIINLTSKLRNSWFSLDDPTEELSILMEKALNVGHIRMFDYSEYLKGEDFYIPEAFNSTLEVDLELYSNCFIRFLDTDSPIPYQDSLSLRNNLSHYVVIPNYFLPHFYYQSIFDGLISQNIRSKFSSNIELESDVVNKMYRDTIKKKIYTMEKNAQFLVKHNISSGLIRFGFHFR